ncbi:MAG: hypothetical protein JSW00_14255 [Thermoplasmata archaeon]|nr:MAG: hypothetical protein JSW00_14255 [Thermoplasmata archaeon]
MNQSNTPTEQDSQTAEPAILRVECDPSLKEDLIIKANKVGFRSQSDALRTLVRDFVAGRITYKSGILQSQEKKAG